MKRPIKRAIHFDYHNLPALPDLGDDFSAEEYVRILCDAKVKYINFFGRCNLGFSYYPTKLGVMHPYLKGKDMLGDMVKECHKHGIGISAYVNGGINHELAGRKREWSVVDKEGRILGTDKTMHDFRTLCFNTGYGDYLVSEVKEILELYPEVDGIFVDCLTSAPPCFCRDCMADMEREGVNIENRDEVYRYNERKFVKIAKRLREAVPKDKNFIINGSLPNGTCYPGKTKLESHSEIECLVTGGWGYEYFPWKVAYERNVFDTALFMTGRFHGSWGDFGGLREKAAIEFDAYYALANAVNVSIGDHLPPRGLPEKAVYKTVKEIYTDIEKLEPWTDNAKYVPEIGIFTNTGDWTLFCETEEYPIEKAVSAFQGLCRMLCELKYQYDVVTKASDLSRYRLIFLPDCIKLNEEEARVIDEYINNGGKVISSGTSALNREMTGFALSKWNFNYMGKDKWEKPYLKARSEIAEGVPNMPVAAYVSGAAVGAKEGNTVLADYWEPYFNSHWDGFHSYLYVPYSKKSEQTAAILMQGNVIHICSEIFRAYNKYQYPVHRKIVENCIKLLLKEKKIKSNLPVFARATLTEKENLLLLHVLSYCPESKSGISVIDEGIKLYESKFSIESHKKPKKIYMLPNKEEVNFEYEDGRISFEVFKIDSHAILAMEF